MSKNDMLYKRSIKLLLIIFYIIIASVCNNRTYGLNRISFPNPSPHPRLLLHDTEDEIKNIISTHSAFASIHNRILEKCNQIVKEPLLVPEMKGPRLLETGREFLSRMSHLAYGYRITSNTEFAKRAISEMINICQFENWNPSHFLDVSEFLIGLAIGYDWLYNEISKTEKEIIVSAIVDKGFNPSYDKKYNRFLSRTTNWNSVCNAGLVYGAIAILEEVPDIAYEIIERSISSNILALEAFSREGGYPEGYNYWNYGAFYQVLLIDALETAFGTDFGLTKSSGFLNTGYWFLFMRSPTGRSFNFSDSPEQAYCNIPIWWFAHKTNDASLVYVDQKLLSKSDVKVHTPGLLPLLPIFASRFDQIEKIPNSNHFYTTGITPTYVYRGGWDSNKDTYLGVKGGRASTPHAHMDAGSFVYENNGIRWAMDLGMQSYHSLESNNIKLWDNSQNGERWDILRMRNDYHNTLTIDSCRHNVNATADFIDILHSNEKKGAIVDLTNTLGKLKKAHREVYIDSKECLHIIDSITTSDDSICLTWVMVTPAKAEIIDNKRLLLSKDGVEMYLTIHTQNPFVSKIWDNKPIHTYDKPNPGSIRVGYTSNIPSHNNIQFEVILSPKNLISEK